MTQINKYLYPMFNHWFRGGNIWVISDQHWGDGDTKFFRKNNLADEDIFQRIYKKIGKNDVLICLGDLHGNINDYPESRKLALDYISRIRGYKVLIMGNHENGKSNYEEYFNEVYDGPIMISKKVMLSHEPFDSPYIFSIHGHKHDNGFSNGHNFNACAEWIDYTPVSLLEMFKKGMFKNVEDIHRQTIDRATARKAKKAGKI